MPTIRFSQIKIAQVDHSGLKYSDKQGNSSYIDFQECRDNWANFRGYSASPPTKPLSKWALDCVGERDRFAKPPYIEFFTGTHTLLEFDNRDTLEDDWRSFTFRLIESEVTTFDRG